MIYKNFEIHNAAELIHNDDESISWKRVPSDVHSAMEGRQTESVVYGSTGVELRFVIKGKKGRWDLATLELGINVLTWDSEKIISRTEDLIRQVAGRNKAKPIFVISPFYNCGDDFVEEKRDGGERWRRLVGEVVSKLNYPNVTYINGLDVIGDMSYMSADEIHPNIYGVQRIADVLTEKIRAVIEL